MVITDGLEGGDHLQVMFKLSSSPCLACYVHVPYLDLLGIVTPTFLFCKLLHTYMYMGTTCVYSVRST